jgi:hypothetical protein
MPPLCTKISAKDLCTKISAKDIPIFIDISAGTGINCLEPDGGEFRFWPKNTIVDG